MSGDGTYQRRGFQSKNGVVTVLSVNGKRSKVLDCETLSNHCDACQKSEEERGSRIGEMENTSSRNRAV